MALRGALFGLLLVAGLARQEYPHRHPYQQYQQYQQNQKYQPEYHRATPHHSLTERWQPAAPWRKRDGAPHGPHGEPPPEPGVPQHSQLMQRSARSHRQYDVPQIGKLLHTERHFLQLKCQQHTQLIGQYLT